MTPCTVYYDYNKLAKLSKQELLIYIALSARMMPVLVMADLEVSRQDIKNAVDKFKELELPMCAQWVHIKTAPADVRVAHLGYSPYNLNNFRDVDTLPIDCREPLAKLKLGYHELNDFIENFYGYYRNKATDFEKPVDYKNAFMAWIRREAAKQSRGRQFGRKRY